MLLKRAGDAVTVPASAPLMVEVSATSSAVNYSRPHRRRCPLKVPAAQVKPSVPVPPVRFAMLLKPTVSRHRHASTPLRPRWRHFARQGGPPAPPSIAPLRVPPAQGEVIRPRAAGQITYIAEAAGHARDTAGIPPRDRPGGRDVVRDQGVRARRPPSSAPLKVPPLRVKLSVPVPPVRLAMLLKPPLMPVTLPLSVPVMLQLVATLSPVRVLLPSRRSARRSACRRPG